MLDRMERRWQLMTLEEVKEFCAKATDESLWKATIEDPMMVTSDFFSGKKLR